MILKLHVMPADVSTGRVDAYACPVARAARREFKKIWNRFDCYIGWNYSLTIYSPTHSIRPDEPERMRLNLPQSAVDWISVYDLSRGKIGDPFSFDLEIIGTFYSYEF